MKLSLRTLFAAAGLLVAAAGAGRAEEISLAPSFEPFADQDVTLVANHSGGCETGACNAGGCDQCNSCCTSRHVGRDFWVCQDRCGGLVGGGEFLFLKPYAEGGRFDLGPGGPDIGYAPAFRVWAGAENSDGIGARMRYFQYDNDDATAVGAISLLYRYVDAEVTQSLAFRRSSLQFSGGFRWAENENITAAVTGPITAAPAISAQFSDFDGIGLTFGAQANQNITRDGGLRMSANARWSLLYGDGRAASLVGVVGGQPLIFIDNQDDALQQVVELNVGPQLRRRMNSGGYLTASAGVEAQYWHNGFGTTVGAVPPVGLSNFSFDTGFLGFSASVGITR